MQGGTQAALSAVLMGHLLLHGHGISQSQTDYGSVEDVGVFTCNCLSFSCCIASS